jgi:class 3 adenylate cyclase
MTLRHSSHSGGSSVEVVSDLAVAAAVVTQPSPSTDSTLQAQQAELYSPRTLLREIVKLSSRVAELEYAKSDLEVLLESNTEHSDSMQVALHSANTQLQSQIEERHRVEQRLRASETELKALFAAMSDVILVLDRSGILLKVVSSNARLPKKLLQGKLNHPLNTILNPDLANLHLDAINRALTEQQTIQVEYSLPLSDLGLRSRLLERLEWSTLWFTANVSPLSEDTVLWVAHDISDRKRAEAALIAEKDRADSLLRNILPEVIAERLKADKQLVPESFESVTILFADIVGFTQLSTRLQPIQLVDLLNRIFSIFDNLAERFGLEKIKTIGDAYMVAAGLPLTRTDHANAIADMALAMQTAVRHFHSDFGENLQIRIGINSGSAVAGVIGTKKFIYDLWGDTVNVANRMESSGRPNRIQVTEATYELLRHHYTFVERGKVNVKGKGPMQTYWLIGKQADTQADGQAD